MYPENPEKSQVDSINMGYISVTARNRTRNLFHPKQEPISLGHSVLMAQELARRAEDREVPGSSPAQD